MNNVKTIFSIKDLENLSGIKAHTIRIWEKRYNVLEPMRTDTNIRYYDLISLQKLLNITLLHNHGYKISKISKYPAERIPELVREIISTKSAKHHAINAFKVAMMNFDQSLFFNTYNTLLSEKTFREVFYEVIIPLMDEIGMLWQSDTITPSHEHFISFLIKQKILINTERLQLNAPTKTDRVYVLYLPMNEIHELGLMYVNHEILYKGYKVIYLGESVPFEDLKNVRKYFENVTFICYMTVQPNPSDIDEYVHKVKKEILQNDPTTQFWFTGRLALEIDEKHMSDNLGIFTSVEELIARVE
jgi:MerR family transcriptional regulator, light-induced transcriptional regulator